MNRKQLIILLILLVVLGWAGLIVHNRNQADYKSSSAAIGQKLLGNFPLNDVAHLAIKQGTNELNLAKKDGLWRVRERNDYPANFSEISDFLIKVRDLKVTQSEKFGPSQLARVD